MNAEQEKVKRDTFNGRDSIQVIGSFDFSSEYFDSIVSAILGEGKKDIVIDLTRTTYLTSTGIANIVKIYKKVSVLNGKLYIANATSDMISLICLARLDRYVEFIS